YSHVTLSFSHSLSSNKAATTVIYTLSLHDALPISGDNIQTIRTRFNINDAYCAIKTNGVTGFSNRRSAWIENGDSTGAISSTNRSEEHTSELQSRENLVCRLLLEKKKNKTKRERNN